MNPEEETPIQHTENAVPEVWMDYREAYPEKPEPAREIPASPLREPLPEVDPASEDFRQEKKEETPGQVPVLDNAEEQEIQPDAEENQHPDMVKHAEKKPVRPVVHRYGFAAGVAVLLLALVGVVAIICVVGGGVASAFQKNSGLREWDAFLEGVVRNDPAPFEHIEDAAAEDLCMCAVLEASENLNDAQYDELGRKLVPYAEAEKAYGKLFGPNATLQAQSGAFYTYDAEKALFFVTPLPEKSGYAPYTESMEKEGETIRLKVGYVAASDPWRQHPEETDAPAPVKWMEYTLYPATEGGQYFILSIREWDA